MKQMKRPMATRKIFLAVDLQKDFIDGSLTVPGAYSVLPEINSVKGAFGAGQFLCGSHLPPEQAQ